MIIPTQTFFNLPQEKQERILEAGVQEFSRHYFNNASISRIVQHAGIPRGSFYQYFTDSKDLYRFLFQEMGKKKQAYLEGVVQSSSTDAFTMIRHLYAAGIRFAKEHPDLARIGNRFYREAHSFKVEILGQFLPGAEEFLVKILTEGQKRGEIRRDIDVRIAATMLFHVNLALIDDITERAEEWDLFHADGAFLKMATKVLDIFEQGMRT